ncbi:MAG: cytochrome c-type biogenesis CcmF C-terminal domain-containing protein, partial [Holosporales bacterium]
YFNNVFVPIATFGLFCMAFGIHLPWRQGSWPHLRDRLLKARTFLIPLLVLLWGVYYAESPCLWLLLAVSAWGFSANLVPLSKWQLWPPKSMSSLAHMAAAAFLGFASLDAFTSRTQDIVLGEGEEAVIGRDLRLSLTEVERLRTPTYMAERYHLAVKGAFGEGVLMPERRFYPGRQVLTTEVALRTRGLSQLYVAATPPLPGGKRAFKVSQHFGIMGLWLAACVMALSAFLCMLKRKRTDRETPS